MSNGAAGACKLDIGSDEWAIDAIEEKLWVEQLRVRTEIHHSLAHAEIIIFWNKTGLTCWRFSSEKHISTARCATTCLFSIIRFISRCW
jgi:hypothetical protein